MKRILLTVALTLLGSVGAIADPIELNDSNLQEMLDQPKPLVIDVYSITCPPCRRLAPIFKHMSNEFGDKYQFAKLSVEKNSHLVRSFNVNGFPTILFFKEGKEVGRSIGFRNEETLIGQMKDYLD